MPLAITACIWLSETTVKDAAGMSPLPPIKTAVAPVKKLPLIVMVPPSNANITPVFVTCGTGANSPDAWLENKNAKKTKRLPGKKFRTVFARGFSWGIFYRI